MWGGRVPEMARGRADVTVSPVPDRARRPTVSSWPGLSRPFASLGLVPGDLDARDKRGHDETEDLARVDSARQELLDLHRDAVAADDHGPLRHRHVVGKDAYLVLLGGIEFDDGAAAEP